jgi:gliding motility-associated-like protein
MTPASGTWSVSNCAACAYYFIDDVYFIDTCLVNTFNPNILGNNLSICGDTNNFPIHLNANTPGAKYLWSTNDTLSNIDVRSLGTYWVKLSKGACYIYDSITIINSQKVSVNLGNDTTVCAGTTLSFSSPIADSYNWYKSSSIINPTYNLISTIQSIFVIGTGSYILEANKSSCFTRDTIQVQYKIKPAVNPTIDTTLCYQSTYNIQADTNILGLNYLWQNGNASSNFLATTQGLYWVKINNAGCEVTDSIRVYYENQININLGNDTSICSNSMLKLHPQSTNVTSYKWKNNTTDSILVVNAPGVYWVDGIKGNCKARDSVSISSIAAPIVNLGADTIMCKYHPLTYSLHNNLTAYLWSSGSVDSTLAINSPGTYWAEATHLGCKVRDSLTVGMIVLEPIKLGNDTNLCQGKMLLLNANTTGGISYKWNTNAISSTIHIDSTGLYWAEATQGNCKVRDSILVTYNPNPIVNLGKDTTICSNIILTLNAGNNGASFLWSTGNTTNTINTNHSGNYWVKVIQNQCSTFDTININTVTAPPVFIGNDTIVCEGSKLTLNAFTIGAAYLWQNASITPTFTVTSEGKYKVQVTRGICKVLDSVFIYHQQKPTLNLGKDTGYCFNLPITLEASKTIADSYLWQDGSSNNTLIIKDAGLYWVEVKKDVCVIRDSILLSQNTFPKVDIGTDKKVCKEEEVILDAKNLGSTFLWNDQSTIQTKKVKAPGLFFVKVTNPFGCFRTDSILLDTFISPTVYLGKDSFVCESGSFIIDAGTFKSYVWQDGSTNQKYEAKNAGNYFVVAKDNNNCNASDTLNLSLKPKPTIKINKLIKVCEPDTFIKPIGNFISYLWQDGTTSSSYRVTDYGTYTVKVLDENYCSNTALVDIKSSCPGTLFLPNAFTPNGDGKNELFFPVTRNVKSFTMQIYNRWGEMIFETDDVNKAWDGKYNNEFVLPDVYAYSIIYTGTNDLVQITKGNVTVLK